MKKYFARVKNVIGGNLFITALMLIGIVLIIGALFNPLAAGATGVVTAMAIGAGNYAGPKPGWSSPIFSDNPADYYGLTKVQATTIAQFLGFIGKDVTQTEHEFNVLIYDGTSAPTLTNYAVMPIGTMIICPKLTKSSIYIHKAQSSTPVVGDWFIIEGAQAT